MEYPFTKSQMSAPVFKTKKNKKSKRTNGEHTSYTNNTYAHGTPPMASLENGQRNNTSSNQDNLAYEHNLTLVHKFQRNKYNTNTIDSYL